MSYAIFCQQTSEAWDFTNVGLLHGGGMQLPLTSGVHSCAHSLFSPPCSAAGWYPSLTPEQGFQSLLLLESWQHAVKGRCSEAKLEKSGFFSRAPLDMNLYELGLTHSSERAWVFDQLQHSRISSLSGQLPLSHSQQGQFITWSNFPHCWCYWKTKTSRANHCSSWKSFCGENEMPGPFTLFFILSSPLASAYGSDLISIFILTLFLCDLGSETISKAMCFGGFICLSQWKKREVTEMEVGRGRGGGKARVGRKEGESKTLPVWKENSLQSQCIDQLQPLTCYRYCGTIQHYFIPYTWSPRWMEKVGAGSWELRMGKQPAAT